jgi:adenosine deaminase
MGSADVARPPSDQQRFPVEYSSYEERRLRRFRDAGVNITFGSDDPPYLVATIEGEYRARADRLGFSGDDRRHHPHRD